MRESDLLAHIAAVGAGGAGPAASVVVGPGDDCAVVRTAGGEGLLFTVDHLIAGRHFVEMGRPGGATAEQVAHKALARSLSDVAAMGGLPRWCLATAAFPAGFGDEAARAIFDALRGRGLAWSCPLVGGDCAVLPAGAPLTLTTTVVGVPHAVRGPVLRSGARPGDGVWVTGCVGDALASGRHLEFEPRVREGAWLCETLGAGLHAMIDVSDGLGRDAGRVAKASGVRIEIEGERVPVYEEAGGVATACAEGEDYELLFTADAACEGRLSAGVCGDTGTRATRIGRVCAGRGCGLRVEGVWVDAAGLGWDHAG